MGFEQYRLYLQDHRKNIWRVAKALTVVALSVGILYTTMNFQQNTSSLKEKIYKFRKEAEQQLSQNDDYGSNVAGSKIESDATSTSNTTKESVGTSNELTAKLEEPLNYSAIWMSQEEADVLLKYMQRGVRLYLEWGSGGSTLNFAPLTQGKAYSIEHDEIWCNQMRDELLARELAHKVEIHCVPVRRGYLGWGKSAFEEGTYKQFESYINEIDLLGESIFDLILIDGRARVPAAIKSLAYISENSNVVIHDGKRIRKRDPSHDYSDIEIYYDFTEYIASPEERGIAVLKRKPEWNWLEGNIKAVKKLLEERETENSTVTIQ